MEYHYDIDNYFGGKNILKHNTEVLNCIKDYASRNIDALSSPMLDIIVFGDTERKKFIQAYKLDEFKFKAFASTHELLSNDWVTFSDPLNLALFLSFAHSNKREFLEFIGIKMMSALFYKYYNKDGSLNPDIMRFIVYGMVDGKPVMSKKYLLKSEGSTMGVIRATISTFADEFLNKKYKNKNLNSDEALLDCLNSLRTRLNLSMRGVRDLYEKNKMHRLYENQDIYDEENNITQQNETIKLTTLNAKITEKITAGLDGSLVRRTNNVRYYEFIKLIYENDRDSLLEFCLYLVRFYAEKTDSINFDIMKRDFVSVVTRAKGLDQSFIYSMVEKYVIKDKLFVRSFLNMHVVLIYDLILRI